jgi:hypothetical protein
LAALSAATIAREVQREQLAKDLAVIIRIADPRILKIVSTLQKRPPWVENREDQLDDRTLLG